MPGKEADFDRLNLTLKARSKSNRAMIHSKNEDEYLQEVCRIIAETCGHAMVWIGYARNDEEKSVVPVAHAGFEEGYLDTLKITWADSERGKGPTGTAIRTGKPCVCSSMGEDPRLAPWREEATRRGYASSAVFPLVADKEVFGAITIYSGEKDTFGEDYVLFLSELAEDVSFGIMSIRLRAAHERAGEDTRFMAKAGTLLTHIVDFESTMRQLSGISVPTLGDWCIADILDEHGQIERIGWAHVSLEKERLIGHLAKQYPPRWDCPSLLIKVLRGGDAVMVQEPEDLLLNCMAPSPQHERIIRELDPRGAICVPLRKGNRIFGTLTFFISGDSRIYREEDLRLAQELGRQASIAVENSRLYAQLRELNRRKDDFLAMLGHEMRNPLAAIVSGLRLLRKAGMEEKREWIQDSLEQQTVQLNELLDDLLDVSRIVRGKLELKKESVPLCRLVETSVEEVREAVESRGLKLIVNNPPVSINIWGDRVRLEQVLVNLLGNAAKYTQEGGSIEVSASSDHGYGVISVKDSGIGINPERQPQIFELFGQMSSTHQGRQGSLGLGLNLVQRLTELHGGSVSVFSEGTGMGSEFVVRLPLAEEGESGTSGIGKGSTEALRILVVEDNEDIAAMMGFALEDAGNQVEVVHDGFDAVEKAASFKPDVILLDIGLPGLDGYEVARRLRTELKMTDCLLVAITGYGQERDKARAQAAGFNEHLVKPVELEKLEPILEKRRRKRTVQ